MNSALVSVVAALSAAILAAGAQAQTPPVPRARLLEVLGALAAPDPETQRAGAVAAGALHHPVVIDPLRALLARGTPEVRLAAARALGELGIPPSSSDLGALISSLLVAARGEDRALATAAAEAAARYPFPDVRTRLTALAAQPETPDAVRAAIKARLAAPDEAEVRARLDAWLVMAREEAQAVGLGVTLDPGALPVAQRWRVPADDLVRHARDLLDPAGAPDRVAVATALAATPAIDEAIPFLTRALLEPAPAARRQAVSGLARSTQPRVEAVLLRTLADADEGVRTTVAEALAQRTAGRAELVTPLWSSLERERVEAVRAALRTALVRAPRATVVAALTAVRRPVPDLAIRDGLAILAPTASSPTASSPTASSATATSATASSPTATATAAPPLALALRWMIDAQDPALAAQSGAFVRAADDTVVLPALLEELARLDHDETRRARVRDLLAPRRDPRITAALLAAVEREAAQDGELALLRRQPEDEYRAPLLALARSPSPRVRAQVVHVASTWHGADVVAALQAALAVAPEDDRAFAALLAQPGDERTGALAELLLDDVHARRRPGILAALAQAQIADARVASAARTLVERQPRLAAHVMPVLEHQREALAVPVLARIAADTQVEVRERVRAIERLAARADHEVAVAHLLAVARDPELDVTMAARRNLHALDPAVFPDWDPYGRIPLVAVGAGFGASMLLLAHDIADAKLSPAFTAGAGLVLGAATPFLLTRGEEVSLGDAAYFASTATWGTVGGWGLGRALDLDAQDTRWLTLAGQGLGLTAGALTLSSTEWSLGDALLANTTALQIAISSAMLHALVSDGEGAGDAAMIAGAVSIIPLTVLARRLEVRDDLGLVFASMGHGAWLGALAPSAFGRADATLGGLVVGQSAGYLTGLALAHFADGDAGMILGSYLGSAVGAAALGGLALSIEGSSGQVRSALTGAGSIGGLLAVGLLGDRLELHHNDGWLIALGGALGAYAGLRLDERMEKDDFAGDRLAGNVLLGSSAGLLGGLVLSQLVDASDAQLVRTLGGGAVLAVGGLGLGRAFDGLDASERGMISGGLFLAGLALTAPFAEQLALETRTVGFATLTSASLAAWGSQVPRWFADDGGPADAGRGLSAGVVGASFGFAGGLALAQVLPVETADLPLIAAGSLVGSLAGLGAGLWVPELGEDARVGLVQGLGLAGLVGASALSLSHDGGALSRGGAAVAPATLLGLHGALLGGLLPAARLDDGGAPVASAVGGGLLLGASLGLTTGLLLTELGGWGLTPDQIAESTLMTSAAHAIGGGLGLLADDARLGAGLMVGAGATTLIGSLLLAPHTSYDAGDTTLAATLGLLGAWHGGWAGSMGDAQAISGGALLGGGLGLASALALAPWIAPDPADVLELGLITEAAAAIGGGLAWSLPDTTDRDRALAISLASAGGLAAATALVSHTAYSGHDLGLIALLMGAATYQGVRAAPLWGEGVATARAGSGVAGAGLGFLGGLALSQAVDIDGFDQAEAALVTGAAHTVAGGLELAIGDLGPRDGAILATATGLGALTTGLLVAPFTEYSSDDGLLVGGGIALGAWHGFLLAPIAGASSRRAIGGSALAGAGAGALSGMLVSQLVEVGAADQAEVGFLALAGDAVGAGLSWMLDDPSSRTTAALTAAVGLGTLGGAFLVAPHTRYGASDYGLVSLSMGLGAWHGAWAGQALGANARGTRASTRVGGGALLGAGAGALVGSALAGFVDVSMADQGEALAMWGYGSAIGGGLALATGSDRLRSAVFVEAGGLAGLAGAAAVSDGTAFSSGDALLVGALGVAGAWHGSTLPVLIGGATTEARGGGALLGAGALALGGHLLTQVRDYDGSDVAEITAGTLLGNAMGFGLGLVIPGTDDRSRMALIDGLGLGALGTMLALAPEIRVGPDVWANTALFGGLGAALGGVLPATWSSSSLGDTSAEAVAGGALLGATLGLGASVLLDGTLPTTADRRETIALGAFAGGLTGSGLGLALSEDDRWAAGLFEGLTLAGALAVGSTLDRVDLTLGDAALGTTWTAYLTWHQLGLTLLTGGTDRQAAGASMAAVGLGTLTGAYLVPRLELQGEDVLMLFAGSVWGSWLGGWSGAMIERQAELGGSQSTGLLMLASVLGSDLGVGITSLILTDVLDVEPTRFAVINLCGLGGMMMGMLGAGFAQSEPLEAGNVIGSLAGLTVGTIVTAFFDFSEAPSPYEETAALSTTAPTALSVSEWFPTARVEPTPDGTGERYLIGVVGRWD